MPNSASSSPSGNGGAIGLPSTKCLSITGIACARPGSADAAVGISVLRERNPIFTSLPGLRSATPRCASADSVGLLAAPISRIVDGSQIPRVRFGYLDFPQPLKDPMKTDLCDRLDIE